MPRFNTALLSPEELVRYHHRISARHAASTARDMDLGDAAEMKAEFEAKVAEYMAKEKAKEIAKLEERLVTAEVEVEEAEAELAAMSPKRRATIEELGYDIYEGVNKAKVNQRETQRLLNHTLGLPRSDEEKEEQELQQAFLNLAFKVGMPMMVREDILESSSYEWDVVGFWKEKIAKCERMIGGMQFTDFCPESGTMTFGSVAQ
jgi:hypothetical protein